MARCGCGTCNCNVIGGTGTTVTGTGTPSDPFVVAAAGGVDCADVRPCLSGTAGVTYVPATGVISADVSGTAGNQLVLDAGGLYVPASPVTCADVRPCLSGTAGVTYVPATGVISADVSGTAGNALVVDAGGLYVPAITCADVRPCLSGTAGVTYVPATGVISADVSGTPGNQLVLDAGGLYVPASPVSCADVRPCLSGTAGVNYDPATGVISADISTDPGNALALGGDGGLYVSTGAVSCADVRPCLSGTAGVTYVPATGVISADVSGTAGNVLVLDAGGLYVPPITCADVRPCLSGTAGVTYVPATGVISADVSGTAGNALVVDAGGLYVPAVTCADVRPCLSGTAGVTYVPATGVISADVSGTAGNTLVLDADGLYVPPATVSTACGLDGSGTAGDPLLVTTAAWPLPCSVDTFGGDLYCDSTGRLRTLPKAQASFVQQINTTAFASVVAPAGTPVTVLTDNLNIPNPDTCRAAFVIVETEVDVDFTLPANSGIIWGIAADDMMRAENKSAATQNDQHWQLTKVFNATIPAGGAIVDPIQVRIGGNFSGTTTYTRIQVVHRAFVFVL